MAARRSKRKAPRRSRGLSILNAVESYGYLNIMTSNFLGTSPMGLLGPTDLSQSEVTTSGYTWGSGNWTDTSMVTSGANQISLGDIVTQPGLAFAQISQNASANYMSAFIQATSLGIGMRVGKRLLRRPISSVNRNILTPLLGKGVLRI
tara:strand:- start:1458 stop:1904 length:447 start_codon:yes stop_codon:yes gene_type:complete